MMKQKQITLNDIALKLNVSKVTVSKALRDHPDIGRVMKKKVREMADQLGYVPNFVARNLSAEHSNTIGLVVPKIAHHFFASTIESIYETAYAHNYEVILMVSRENEQNEMKQIQTLLSMRVDGLLVSVTEMTKDSTIFETVQKRKIPLVFFDRAMENLQLSRVTSDDEGGSYEAVLQLIEAGHKRIAHLAGYQYSSIGMRRRAGYERALDECQIQVPAEYIIEGGFGEADGYLGFMKLFKKELPEAIFAVTYPVALGVLAAAENSGIKIPQDLDLICFGGSEYNRFISPSLSFINQPTDEIGRIATELLVSEIQNPDQPSTEIIVPTKLIKCETCMNCNEAY